MTPRRWAAVLGAVACVGFAVLGPIPSAGAGQRAAQLSIAIDDGRESAAVGDVLEYTISVTNTGADQITDLVVTQSLPAGLAFGSAGGDGVAAADAVTWTTDLAAGQLSTFSTSMTVTATGDGVLRLATVACAAESPDGPPIVCAADSDLLPAGAAATGAAPEEAAVQADPIDSRWYIGAGSGIVIVAGLLVLLLVQRRRDRAAGQQPVA